MDISIFKQSEWAVRRQISDVLTNHDDRIAALEAGGGGGAQPAIQFEDEGVNLGSTGTVTALDFVGAGVTASRASNTVTVTIPGGGGGGNAVQVSVDFGSSFTDKASTVVTGQSWVTPTSVIVALPYSDTADPDEMYLLSMRAVVSNLVNGVGFTVTLYSEPEAKGTYYVNCIGV